MSRFKLAKPNMSFYKECFSTSLNVAYYCVSPKIRLTMQIRPSMNFHDDCNIRPTHKISPVDNGKL